MLNKAQALKAVSPERVTGPELGAPRPDPVARGQTRNIRLVGAVPPEVWNRLATRVLPMLRTGLDLKLGVDFSVTVNDEVAESLTSDLRQILDDLGLADKVQIQDA